MSRESPVSPAPAQAVASAPPPAERRYRVFISYSHADTKWANWLMGKLEGYRVPARFQGKDSPVGTVGPRIAPVFRDRDELPTTSDLGETIRAALRNSATLVVVCSPRAAKSRWVAEEIVAFKRLHGERRVFAFIVAGEPKHEGAEDDCFSPALRRELGADGELSGPPAEVVAADARAHGDGRGTAFLRLVSGLLGVGFDDLRQRELQRRNRRLTFIAAGSALGMAVTFGLAVAAWRARNDAQRRQDQAEGVLGFMLGDFRDDLQKVGQLPLLEKVGVKAMEYFDTADPRDLTDTALARQAKALTQIGEVKLLQKNVSYAEAARAFFTAYQRAAELAARHPTNGEMLYERAQAEFWIGNTHYKRGDWTPAGEWFGRYRDSAAALVALDPGNLKWQRELVSGRHNLAVLDVERGQLAEARAGFLSEMKEVRRLATADPKNSQLQFRITDIDSYLGSIAARMGELTEARARFAAQRTGLENLLRIEPTSAQWNFKLGDCLMLEAEILAITGDLDSARASIGRGRKLIVSMLSRDSSNRRWLGVSSIVQLREAAMEMSRDPAGVARILMEETARLEKNRAAESQDRVVALRLITAWRLTARLRLESGTADAAEAAARALEVAQPLLSEARANDRLLAEIAQAAIVAGRIAAAAGKPEQAQAHWHRVIDWLTPRLAVTNDWTLLDPAARVLAFVERTTESRALVARLHRFGYVPLEPWPALEAPSVSVSNSKSTKQ